jgi:hypothetical protein
MLVMASMSWCMLFNFMVLLGFIMADFVPWGETQLSGGLCCGGKRCHHGDAYLWTKWTENSTLTNLIDASSSSSRLGGTCVTSLPLPPPRTLFIVIHVDRMFVTQLIQDCYSSSEYCRLHSFSRVCPTSPKPAIGCCNLGMMTAGRTSRSSEPVRSR